MPKTKTISPSPEPTLLDQMISPPEYEEVYGRGNPWVEWLRRQAPKLLRRPARKVIPQEFRRDASGRFKAKPGAKVYGEDDAHLS